MRPRPVLGFGILWAAISLLPRSAAAGSPYSYDGPGRSAKAVFQAEPGLRADPEFSLLLSWAEDPSQTERMTSSRERLAAYAHPIGLALGDIDTDGWAQAFFHEELAARPVDYRGIIRKFSAFEKTAGSAAQEGEPDWETISPALTGRLKNGAMALGQPMADDDEEVELDESIEHAFAFRQEGYKLADLQGDVALLTYTKRLPAAIKRSVLGGGAIPSDKGRHRLEVLNPVVPPEYEDMVPEEAVRSLDIPGDLKDRIIAHIRNSRLVIEGRNNPIKPEAMKRMFTQVIAEEAAKGVPPKRGTPHRWSKAFALLYKDKPGNIPFTRFSKLLLALASGVTHRFMVTERELPLLTYILGRPDGAITIDELFRKSYQLNDGDVYLTLLTLENVLAEFWRTDQRENRAVTRKLAPITNHWQDRGDKFGAWYHLFGLALYAYATDERTAAAAGRAETLGSHVLSRGKDETQEDWINRMGPVIGGGLQDIVRNQRHRDFKPGGIDHTDPALYLDLAEDFRDRIFVAPSRGFAAEFSADGRLVVASEAGERRGCLLELIPDKGKGLDARLAVKKAGFGLPASQPVLFHEFGPEVRAVRAFLSRCETGEDAVIIASRPVTQVQPDPDPRGAHGGH